MLQWLTLPLGFGRSDGRCARNDPACRLSGCPLSRVPELPVLERRGAEDLAISRAEFRRGLPRAPSLEDRTD